VFVRAILTVAISFSGFTVHRANAQNAAAISGTVQDQQKATIVGAKVTATRSETGDVHQTKTDGSGFYSFPVLLPGHYDLKVEEEGTPLPQRNLHFLEQTRPSFRALP
jgi:hypothetical protein